jgi:hypothetical protein
MTREEHLQWCKDRALAYCEKGETMNAISSMTSDLGKHPDTANHAGIKLGAMLMFGGHLSTAHECRKFIEGFN